MKASGVCSEANQAGKVIDIFINALSAPAIFAPEQFNFCASISMSFYDRIIAKNGESI